MRLHALAEKQRAQTGQHRVFRPRLLRHRVKRRALQGAAGGKAERHAVFLHLSADCLADRENKVGVKRAGEHAGRGEAGRVLMADRAVVLL